MKKIAYIVFFLLSTALFAQKVTTAIDTTRIKIGAEFKLTLKASVDTVTRVVFPNLKNIGALEVIRSYPIDTIRNNDRYELIKKYGLTQFDSGKYTIPRVSILINKKPIFSDSILVEVANVKVDTLQQKMYDIKDIVAAESHWGNWWKYLLAIILLAGLGALGYWYFKKKQKKDTEEEVYTTPIEKATSLLTILEKKELWQQGEIKEYYSQLTDIARNYIEEAIEIPAMESTTSELITALKAASVKKKMTLSQETIENLERVLKQADLVKFAKSKPLDFEITEDRNKIQKAILTLDKAIPVEVPEEEDLLLNEAQRQHQIQLQLKKKRAKQIRTAIVSALLLLVLITGFFVATRGFGYVIDTVFGRETKELLEGEWVKSEYGNPGILIETPQVLKRIDAEKVLPKNTMALIKEMQLFQYGDMMNGFHIMVSTSQFKQPTDIDLAKAMEGNLKIIEAQGGQNIIVKQEDFETESGVQGLKGYGTMSMLNPLTKSSEKVYYEILYFKQNQGLQQIMIVFPEGDQYGSAIAERMLQSVELRQAGN